MKIYPIIIAASLLPFAAQAEGFGYEATGGFDGLYGYGDVSERYEGRDRDNDLIGDAYINLEGKYEFDKESSASLHLDVMSGFNKQNREYNNGSWGKEIYGILDSKYGRLMAGETYNIAYQFSQKAYNVGSIDVRDFINNPNQVRRNHRVEYKTLTSTAIDTDGVAPKITYITPEFYNTYIGVSYINDIKNRRGLTDKQLHYSDNDGYVASIYNTEEIYGIDVATSLGYADFRDGDKDMSAGISFFKGGWTLSSSYRKTYIDGNKDAIAADLSDNYREGYAWDVGLGYEIGPYEVSLSYFNSKAKNTGNQDKIVMLSNQYKINKYAKVYLAAAHVKNQGENKNAENNNQGYAFIAGFGLNF